MTERHYEASDIPPKGAAFALGGLLASLLVVGAIVAALLAWMGTTHPQPRPIAPANPPAPRLQVAPQPERREIEAAARARLRGDATHPSIEEAMRMVAARGWHDTLPAPSAVEAARAHSKAGQ